MSLASGTRIGAYEVLSSIGAGGMGEVYKALDTRLSRQVAIKALPDLMSADPERVARFEREAQVLASLNHPHIGAIYGVEVADGGKSRYLILEFIDGESLAGRLGKGALPFDEAMTLARQMLDALEAAHEKGIVHRDLKPANLMLTSEGQLKILDFGLARVVDSDPGASAANSPTLTFAATQVGVILGTAAYMSPEQAKGRVADRRSDVWAFGCVFFEMLSGKRVFDGEDISETLAAVLRAEPDWTALPGDLPPGIRALLQRCLMRDRKARVPEIGTVRFLLEDALAAPTLPAVPAPAVVMAPPRPFWKRALPVALAAILAGTLGVAGALWLKRAPVPAVSRFAVALPEGQSFSSAGRHTIAISPDGSRMAYVASNQLHVRAMSELASKPVPGTEIFGGSTEVVFSPNGQELAFFAASDNSLKRIAITGGAPVTIGPATNPFGMNWGEDGLVFGQNGKGVVRVSPNGGTQEVLVAIADPGRAHGPQILPDGQTVLFTLATGTAADRWDKADIVAHSLKTGERKRLIAGGSDARYLSTGHIIYALGGTLFAVPFDLKRLAVTGGPAPVVEGVRRAPSATTGAAQYAISASGALAYIPGPATASTASLEIVRADRKGSLQTVNVPPGPYLTPRVSPDGKRIAFASDEKEAVVWTYDLAGTSAMQRLTFGGNNRAPIWSADSKRVAFQSDREGDLGIFWQLADGTGAVERLTKAAAGESHEPHAWSPVGSPVLLFDIRKGSDVELWMLSLADGKLAPFGGVRSSNSPTGAVFDPSGRWVAYTSTQDRKTTVYVQPFPATGAKYEMLVRGSDGPHEVTWSVDGKELFYNPRPGGFEAVPVITQPTFAFGNPVALPRSFTLGPPAARRMYDHASTGQFIGLASPGTGATSGPVASPPIHVVLNWFEELRQRVPR